MPKETYCFIGYFLIGLVCSIIFGTWSKLSCPELRWDESDVAVCGIFWVLWPVMVPVAIFAMAEMYIEDKLFDSSSFVRRIWDKLPEASGLHPAEWFFAWPAKLYLLIRRKNEATGSD